MILLPTKKSDIWVWDGIEIRPSSIHGDGVFATRNLAPGTFIPILGVTQREKPLITTHTIKTKHGYINGLDPHGLNIWARINEPMKRSANCVFKRSGVIVGQTIKTGEELTIYYGNEYSRNYPIGQQQSNYPQLFDKTFPTRSQIRTKLLAQGVPKNLL